MKNLILAAVLVSFAFTGVAKAQSFTGAVTIDDFGTGAAFTSSSLTLSNSNAAVNGNGTFALIPSLSLVTVDQATITGLSASPVSESINDFFVFSEPNASFGAAGTTPNDRFSLTLTSLTETNGTVGDFSGAGTLVDTQGAATPTSAIFTLSFSGPSNYSLTLAATPTPEPSTWSLTLGGLALLALSLRMRRTLS